MALIGNIEQLSGFEAGYHNIGRVEWSKSDDNVRIYLYSYKDAAARIADKKPEVKGYLSSLSIDSTLSQFYNDISKQAPLSTLTSDEE